MNEAKLRIYKLLILGGALVAANFILTWIFGARSQTMWWVANVFHFSGGIYAFFLMRALFLYVKSKQEIKMPVFLEIFLFVAGALVLGVFWEWLEFVLERYVVLVLGGSSFMTYADTIGDLFLDFSGALLAGIYIYKIKRSA